METGFWNANSRTNEIAFKFGTELTSTSRRVDRFAPEAAVPQMLIPRIERWATGRRKIRGLSNEPIPLPDSHAGVGYCVETSGRYARLLRKRSSQALVLMFRQFPDGVLHAGSW
jgi:hypothetical protein